MSREIAWVAIWMYGGCTAETGSPAISENQVELAAAMERWEQVAAESYSYDFQRLCNCLPEATAKVHVEVTDGGISSLHFAEPVYYTVQDTQNPAVVHKVLKHEKGLPVPERFHNEFDHIVYMMGEMKTILAKKPPPYEYEAVFDKEIGIACRVYVNMSGPAIDEEVEFVVSNFAVTPDRPSLEMGCSGGQNRFAHFPQPD